MTTTETDDKRDITPAVSVGADQLQTVAPANKLPGRRRVTGRNGAQLTPFDAESARAASRKRWDDYRQAAEVAAVLEVQRIAPHVSEAAAAYGLAVGAQMRVALDTDHPATAAAFRNVRSALGADVGRPDKDAAPAVATAQTLVIVGDSAAAHVADLLRARMEQNNSAKSDDRG